MMMKLLLFFPLIFLVSASSAALEIKHLVLPEKPTKWEEKAAGEFAAYFRKINNRPLKQYTAGDSRIPKTGGLYLGNAAEEKLAVSQAESGQLKAGGYLLKIRTGNAGITGAHSGGILYGVCALLEIGGVKVYGEECEVLPRKLLFPDTLFKVSNPAFLLRVLEPGFWRWNRYYAEPMTAVRLGFTAQFHDDYFGDLFIPSWEPNGLPRSPRRDSGHSLKYLVPRAKYGKTHPEYFAHDIKGKPIKSRYNHLCLSNPEVSAIISGCLRKIVEKYPSTFFFVTQDDMDDWCQCAACRALDPFPGKKDGPTRWTNLSDRYFQFLNPIAKEIRRLSPERWLLSLAYRSTAEPPVGVLPEKNIGIVIAASAESGNPCQSHGVDCPKNRKFRDSIFPDWSRKAPGQIFIWNYCMNFVNRYSPFFPHDAMVERLRYYKKHHVVGMFYNGAPRMFIQLFCYVQGKLLWNPDLDEKKLEEEFLEHFYGPGAPAMKRVLAILRDRIHDPRDPVHQGEYASFDAIIEPLYLADMQKAFQEAEQAAEKSQLYLKRVRYEKLSAFLLPMLDGGYCESLPERLKMLREIVECAMEWKLINILPNPSVWFEKKMGFSLKTKSRNWYSDPFIQKLLAAETQREWDVLAEEAAHMRSRQLPYRETSDGRIEFNLDAIAIDGPGWGPGDYAHQCEKRRALGILGGDTMRMRFRLDAPQEMLLRLHALDHDKEGKTAIRISMNGSPVYSGKNQASKTGWTVLEYPVRAKMLRQGENTLEIRNLEKKITNGNWFMISGAEIIRK